MKGWIPEMINNAAALAKEKRRRKAEDNTRKAKKHQTTMIGIFAPATEFDLI